MSTEFESKDLDHPTDHSILWEIRMKTYHLTVKLIQILFTFPLLSDEFQSQRAVSRFLFLGVFFPAIKSG